jgi:hypothetical protein
MAQFALIAIAALGAGSQIMGAQSQAEAQKKQAQQTEAQGVVDYASSTRDAAEEYRKSRILQSRALAVAASSGGGTLDPNVVNIISGIAGQGDYNARSQLYAGETRKQGLQYVAEADRKSAQATQTGGYLNAASTALSMYSKYGGESPSSSPSSTPTGARMFGYG